MEVEEDENKESKKNKKHTKTEEGGVEGEDKKLKE